MGRPFRGSSPYGGLGTLGARQTGEIGSADDTVSVIQLTDLHLFADPQGRLLGQRTRATFEAVLAHALASHWPADALLLTGDLVHDERIEGYRWLGQRLRELGVPRYCIPGNHDRLSLVSDFLDPRARAGLRVEPLGGWDLILLDSTVPGVHGGYLSAGLVAELDAHLGKNPLRPALICLHHQPVPAGSAWIDTMMVANPAELLAVVDRHHNARGLLWGHVHQQLDARRNDTLLLATPSTCIQFLPKSECFALDTATPGYRWLRLHGDGRIESAVERIGAYPDPLQPAMVGY